MTVSRSSAFASSDNSAKTSVHPQNVQVSDLNVTVLMAFVLLVSVSTPMVSSRSCRPHLVKGSAALVPLVNVIWVGKS